MSGKRRVLFLGSPFFGYHRHIARALERRGFEVDHFNDRPNENPFLKGAIRVRPGLVKGIVERYQASILAETRERHYDLIFVVNGKVFTPRFIEDLRAAHPGAEAVLYLWDAIDLYPHVLEFAHLFDRRYTFDAADARTHPSFTLWPLFYTDDYLAVGSHEVQDAEHDIVNVCSAHANRYVLMKRLVPQLRSEGLRVFSYLYLNPVQFAYNKVRVPAFRHARRREFQFRVLPVPDYVGVLSRSRAVLDVSHSSQTGLTIRTIETIGARRKLITTNADVRDYDLYHPSRVLLIDADEPDVDAITSFLAEPQHDLDPDTYRRYGIDAWVGEMVGDRGDHDV